jgi:hypothetical protein
MKPMRVILYGSSRLRHSATRIHIMKLILILSAASCVCTEATHTTPGGTTPGGPDERPFELGEKIRVDGLIIQTAYRLAVFHGNDGDNWVIVQYLDGDKIRETVKKDRISRPNAPKKAAQLEKVSQKMRVRQSVAGNQNFDDVTPGGDTGHMGPDCKSVGKPKYLKREEEEKRIEGLQKLTGDANPTEVIHRKPVTNTCIRAHVLQLYNVSPSGARSSEMTECDNTLTSLQQGIAILYMKYCESGYVGFQAGLRHMTNLQKQITGTINLLQQGKTRNLTIRNIIHGNKETRGNRPLWLLYVSEIIQNDLQRAIVKLCKDYRTCNGDDGMLYCLKALQSSTAEAVNYLGIMMDSVK